MVYLPLLFAVAAGLALVLRPWPLFSQVKKPRDPGQRKVGLLFVKWVERQALARGLKVRGVARPVPVVCPRCTKASNYFVYPDELCERCWRATLKPAVPGKETQVH